MFQKKYAIGSIALVLALVGTLASQIPNLEFDYDFENFFPVNDPDLSFYRDFAEDFGSDNDYLLLGIGNEKGLFDSTFVQNGIAFSKTLAALEGTIEVVSPLTFQRMVKSPMGYVPLKSFHPSSVGALTRDSLRWQADQMMRSLFMSDDMSHFKLLVMHEKFIDADSASRYLDNVKGQLVKHNISKAKIVGRIAAQETFLSSLKIDFSRFLIISAILVTIMLTIFMRKANLVIISLGISGLSIIATLGLFVLTGKSIDILSTLIPSILLVVSMSDIIHLFTQIRSEYALTKDKTAAIKAGVKKVGWATFLTSFTTAVGFLTLVTISVKPIIGLGIYSAAGILIAYTITYLMFPQVMLLSTPKLKSGRSQFKVDAFLRWATTTVFRKGTQIAWTALGVTVFICIGLSFLSVDAKLLDDLPDSNSVKQDFLFFDKQFGGSKPFTMSVEMMDSTQSLYSQPAILEMEKLVNIIDTVFEVNSIISPNLFVKSTHQSLKGGVNSAYHLPASPTDWKKTLREVQKLKPWERLHQNSLPYKGQITGFDRDLGSRDAAERTERFMRVAAELIDPSILKYQLTGTTVLINKSNDSLSFNLIQGIFIAVFIVGILSGLMFKSWRMIVVTLIPNLIPILAVGAAMGYLGIPVNMGSSVIFAISFGIVVDDSIHFLSKFRLEKAKGLSHVMAIKNTIQSTGEAIILTTIILTAGFAIFCLSNFTATFYIGLFVSVSFIVAVLADLFLLPVLILRFIPDKNADH